ncbi:MAG: ankyrin repeat domain-containing protein [Nannocystales bacterium]
MTRYEEEIPNRADLERAVATATPPDQQPSAETWWRAVCLADLETIRRLVSDGANVNARDLESGATGLHHAVTMGNRELMRALIDCGAGVDEGDHDGCRPLHYAASFRLIDLIDLLLASGARVNVHGGREEDRNTTPLHMALGMNWLSYPRGLQPRARASVDAVVLRLVQAGAKVTLRNGLGTSPLELAMGTTSFESMLATVSHADRLCDPQGWTLLHVAAWKGELSAVRLLLARGCDPNRETTREWVRGEPMKHRRVTVGAGVRPLDLAQAQAKREVVDELRGARASTGRAVEIEPT